MPHAARHALPTSRRAAVLPSLLILAAGSALAGMAALPGPAAAAGGAGTAARTPTSPPVGAAEQDAGAELGQSLAQSLAQERRDERASRDRLRTPTLPVAPPSPVVAPAPPPPPPPPQYVRPGTGRLTSGYGTRWGRLHAGIDLAAGVGAPISAVADGTVASAGSEGGYGRAVRLQHDDGSLSLYAHMSELLVSTGQRVTAGTYLGLEGSSGNSTGPHLHFEIRAGGVPVATEPWLRARGVDPAAP